VKGKKLKIEMRDGKELKIPADLISKIRIFGDVEVILKNDEKVKEILFVPKKVYKLI